MSREATTERFTSHSRRTRLSMSQGKGCSRRRRLTQPRIVVSLW